MKNKWKINNCLPFSLERERECKVEKYRSIRFATIKVIVQYKYRTVLIVCQIETLFPKKRYHFQTTIFFIFLASFWNHWNHYLLPIRTHILCKYYVVTGRLLIFSTSFRYTLYIRIIWSMSDIPQMIVNWEEPNAYVATWISI